MTTFQALVSFALAAALLTITPGMDTALVLRTAAVEGARRAIAAGLGVATGCLGWGLVVALGLGALLATSETAYTILRWAGAAYLLYLGGRMILTPRRAAVVEETASGSASPKRAPSAAGWFGRGFATNMLNPKVGLFYITFLPQFVPTGIEPAPFTALLAAIHACEGVLWFGLLAVATRSLGTWLSRPSVFVTLDRLTGSILVAFGVRLALDSRA